MSHFILSLLPRRYIGRPLRILSRLLAEPTAIKFGPNCGHLWQKNSASPYHWLGIYELPKQVLFTKLVSRGDVVLDVGANVGFYTLLAHRCVGSTGKVVAFEPLPRNLSYLKQHILINKLEGIVVVPSALSNSQGTMRFSEGPTHAMGRISEDGQHLVNVNTLDSWWSEATERLKVSQLKIDVEGAEHHVLDGARVLLKELHPMIFLAIHGTDQLVKCSELLHELGYTVEIIEKPRPAPRATFDITAEILAT